MADPEEVDARAEALSSLKALNEKLFTLREGLRLPGQDEVLGKRKRTDPDEERVDAEEAKEYWLASARDSLSISDA